MKNKLFFFIVVVLMFFISHGSQAQVSVYQFEKSKTASQVQGQLPDSLFDVSGSFTLTDTVNVNKLVFSCRSSFQDTLSTTNHFFNDTLYIYAVNPSGLEMQRSGHIVNYNYPSLPLTGFHFYQIDIYNLQGNHIGRKLYQE